MNSLSQAASTHFADVNMFARPTILTSVDEDSFQLLQMNIESWKFNMRRSGSVETLINEIERLRPSLVVMDSMFRFEETLQTLARIRGMKHGQHVPVVLLSGFPDEAHRKEALDHGVTGYIAKPVVLENLQAYFTCLVDVFENRYRRLETL